MDVRFIGGATLAAAATGVAGVASGVAFSAWVLMAIGLALTVIAAGVAITVAMRRRPRIVASGETIEMHGTHEAQASTAPTVAPEPQATPAPESQEGPESDVVAPTHPDEGYVAEAEAIKTGATPPPAMPVGVGPREVLEAFLLSCNSAGEVLSAHLWLLDDTSETMRLVDSVGSARPSATPLAVTKSIIGEAATGDSPVLSSNARMRRDDHDIEVWRYAVPLHTGIATGAVALDVACAAPDRTFLDAMSEHFAGALSAALAMHVARTESAAAEALLEAVGEIVRLVDPQAIVESALERAISMSDAHSGSVMLLETDGSMRIRAARGLPDRVVSEAVVRAGEGIAGMVLTTGESLLVEDLEGRSGRARRHGVRSALAVPIADDEGLLGVLNVGSRRFHARFSSSHRATLESLGRIMATALRNAYALTSSQELYLDTVKALALALETKDPFSHGSTERVYEIANRLGERMEMAEKELRALGIAALLHDIGMAAAGNVCAVGERPLTTVERGMLKMHPVIAADALKHAAALKDAVPIVYHHHEHYDGQGYVLGLAGEGIPLGARVLAVADAYVAMTSPRSYRDRMDHDAALAELVKKAGTQFDPRVVDAFSSVAADFAQGRVC